MDHLDFGRYLTQQRELRGMTRDEVAAATKLSVGVLAALEEGRSERLPSRVFVINYIRTYARAIGLQPDETVLRFEEIDRTMKVSPPPAALERARRKRAVVAMIVFFVVVVGGLFAVFALFGGTAPAK